MAAGIIINSQSWTKPLSERITEGMLTEFENSFIAAPDFSILNLRTMSDQEGGAVMFKHLNNSKNSFGILFNHTNGVMPIVRLKNGTWFYKNMLMI